MFIFETFIQDCIPSLIFIVAFEKIKIKINSEQV